MNIFARRSRDNDSGKEKSLSLGETYFSKDRSRIPGADTKQRIYGIRKSIIKHARVCSAERSCVKKFARLLGNWISSSGEQRDARYSRALEEKKKKKRRRHPHARVGKNRRLRVYYMFFPGVEDDTYTHTHIYSALSSLSVPFILR